MMHTGPANGTNDLGRRLRITQIIVIALGVAIFLIRRGGVSSDVPSVILGLVMVGVLLWGVRIRNQLHRSAH